MPTNIGSAVALVCLLAMANTSTAQPAPGTLEAASRPIPAGILDRFITPFSPLKFTNEVKILGLFSSLGNTAFKPNDTEGPFPSIVVTHSCGGVDTLALRERMKEFLEAGYLVLMLDSFQPRGQKDCRNGVIRNALVWRDTFDALAHLQTLKEVDKGRIYQVGYSMGAFTAAVVASPSVSSYFGSAHRFRASVGWYGSCGFQAGPAASASNFLRFDIDRPVLMLMAEADRETPIKPFCYPLMEELKAAGRPVDWHIYGNGVTHAWDVRSGYSMTTGLGETV
ncbi:dienelactone hydrolase family protein, partial [Hydrogenophaga sp.]|uniref:dienelactone hydrolase family protein n=1 Tax=Hydrogenophaga sp. TaxID=1904254 RepID=UPI00356A010A